MSLPQETLLQLMALADHELEGEDLARVEALVAADVEARQVVDAMRSPVIGNWLAEEMSSRSAAADGIADAVMTRLTLESAPSTAGAADRVTGSGAQGGAAARPLVSTVQGRRKTTRVQVFAGVLVGAFALAAGVAIYFNSVSPGVDESRAPVASVGTPSVDVQPLPAPATAAMAQPSQGVEVDEVDSPSRGFSVFEIPVRSGAVGAANAAGPSSVVIMIDDDQGTK